MPLLALTLFLFLAALGYLALADRLNIIDKPNERSSHTVVTIRGGGILFPLAWVLYAAANGWAFPLTTIGVVLLAAISLADDVRAVPARLRFAVHAAAFTLLLAEAGAFALLPWWGVLAAYVLGIGIVNAYNFMDGINGITGLYTLALLLPLAWATPEAWDIATMATPYHFLIPALLVFGWFNFRRRARCFAGDVGSVTLGYIVFFLLFTLFQGHWVPGEMVRASGATAVAGRWTYILLLGVYGVDTTLTIIHRLRLGENIFKAHRRHLYQLLANERCWPHLAVAGLYAGVQALIAVWVVQRLPGDWAAVGVLAALGAVYVGVRYVVRP